MTWQLRRAGEGDLDAIMLLEESIFSTDAWSRATMRAEVANAQGYYLVAFRPESPDRVDGYSGLFAPRRAPQADVNTIAVAPAARRRGLGRVLMLAMLAEARERGAHEVLLEVRADNPSAQALYRDLGFVEIAVRPRYYQPDDVDAVVMRLVFIEPETVPATGSTIDASPPTTADPTNGPAT
ncbi:ribosomal protein S18-alanine N-acetyltransferase [Marisediminicola sp. LYQ85]|uniref:ribosomal protein S18-alanine N-acetyltransferase n=1 Tax=Marisediminicola sp. LYQ85 TaxID=3391062 RepID=UPI0039833DF1